MAKTVSNEELQFRKKARRRLIGAIALVLVAVVVLPMVLDREPKPVSQSVDIRIPSKDNVPELPLQAAPVPPAAAPAVPEREAAEPAVSKPAAPPAPKTEAAKKPDAVESGTRATGKPGSAPPEGGFVVQLGAFSSAANARQQQEKLSASGFKSYTEAVKTAQGTQTRVRAGPYPTREAAEKAREQLKKLGIDGLVTTK